MESFRGGIHTLTSSPERQETDVERDSGQQPGQDTLGLCDISGFSDGDPPPCTCLVSTLQGLPAVVNTLPPSSVCTLHLKAFRHSVFLHIALPLGAPLKCLQALLAP